MERFEVTYYIVFFHFNCDIHRIDSFDNEEAWLKAVDAAQKQHNAEYDLIESDRDWFQFKTWKEIR